MTNQQLEALAKEKLEKLTEQLTKDKLTADELANLSREFFADAEKLNVNLAGGYDAKLRLTLQAQFFQGEAARKRAEEAAERERKHNRKIEWRDFCMEVGVMLLIAFELKEGREQSKVLAHLDSSTAQTATAMSQATTALQHLADEQKRAADRLQEMSENLQSSAGAARNQLQILKQEQADTIAERSRKPKLILLLGDAELDPKGTATYIPPNQTETSARFDFLVSNHGNATAHSLVVRVVIWDEAVGLVSDGSSLVPPTALMGKTHVYLLPIDRLLPGGTVVLPITLTFPKNTRNPIHLTVSSDSEETSTGTPLADLKIRLNGPTRD